MVRLIVVMEAPTPAAADRVMATAELVVILANLNQMNLEAVPALGKAGQVRPMPGQVPQTLEQVRQQRMKEV